MLQAEVDLVARGVGQPHRSELGAQRADGRQSRFNRRRGPGIVAGVERLLRADRLIDDGGEAGGERRRRIGAGVLREAGQT